MADASRLPARRPHKNIGSSCPPQARAADHRSPLAPPAARRAEREVSFGMRQAAVPTPTSLKNKRSYQTERKVAEWSGRFGRFAANRPRRRSEWNVMAFTCSQSVNTIRLFIIAC